MTERTAPEAELLARQELPLPRLLLQAPALLRTLDGASIALLWACVAVARLLPRFVEDGDAREALVAVFTLPLLVILPRQLGLLARPLGRAVVGEGVHLGAVAQYTVSWLAGIWLMVLGLVIFTGLIGVPAGIAAAALLLIATGSSVFYGFQSVSAGEVMGRPSAASLARGGWPFVASLLLVAAPLVFIRVNQPYPLQVGWGLFNYSYRVLQFVENDYIRLAPGLHTSIHAALLGVSGLATGADVPSLLWTAPLLLFVAYGLGVYVLLRRLTGENFLSLVGLWVALWVLSLTIFQHLHAVGMRGVMLAVWPWILLLLYEQVSSVQRTWQNLAAHLLVPLAAMLGVTLVRSLLPSATQAWGLLVLVAMFGWLVALLPARLRQSVGLFTFIGASLSFTHIVEGPVFYGAGIGFVLLLAWNLESLPFRLLIAAGYAVVAGFVALQIEDIITFDDPSLISRTLLGSGRADAIPLPFDSKLNFFKDGMTYPIMGLLAFSAVRVLIWPDRTHLAAAALIAGLAFVYFLPESGLHRSLGPAIPLLGLLIALELAWLAQRLLRLRWREAPALLKGALVLAALVALTPSLTSSLRAQVGLPSRLGFPLPEASREFSSITTEEYRAAVWVEENIPDGWAVVSDPTTMFFIEGLTLHPQVAQKRAWVAESEYSEEDRARLRSVRPLVFEAPTVEEALAGMKSLTEGHEGFVLVLSTRTIMWLTDPNVLFALGRPIQFLMEEEPVLSFCGYHDISPCPSRFLGSELFFVLYNRDGVAVLVSSDVMSPLDALRCAGATNECFISD